MSIHTMVINGLLHNQDAFAHQPVRSLTTEAFKADLSHNDAIPNRFHPHAQAHGPAHGKHLEQQHVRPLPSQPTTSTAAIAISTTSRSRQQWRPIRRISRALKKHIRASPCDNRSTAKGRYQPSAYEDDKGKDHPPSKSNVRRRQPTDNDGGTPPPWTTSAEFQPFPQHDDQEDEPQATPPRTKGLRGALAKKIPPTKLPPGKAFCQTTAANAPDHDQEEGVADNTWRIAGRTPDEMKKQAALVRSSQFQKQVSAAYQHRWSRWWSTRHHTTHPTTSPQQRKQTSWHGSAHFSE